VLISPLLLLTSLLQLKELQPEIFSSLRSPAETVLSVCQLRAPLSQLRRHVGNLHGRLFLLLLCLL
jgi:hypothetical protein